MTLSIFDSKSQQLRAFEPIQPGCANLYVCGPTVQSAPHVGHLRSAVAFDIVASWMRFGHGLKVTLVRNVTDIDDKILVNAAEQGVDWQELAVSVEAGFNRVYGDLSALADVTPHATEHIIDMVALIERLISRGYAYQAADGSANVFFDSASWADYGQLTNQGIESMEGEDAASHGRRRATDFALWKAAKVDEPDTAAWSSPWGLGRPGWHIECSAMTRSVLGEHFDIHGGGLDLRFPHHENELAQSRAAGFEFANYWMHNGLVTVAGQKMSKSLGNLVFVDALRKAWDPRSIRLGIIEHHYRNEWEWDETLMPRNHDRLVSWKASIGGQSSSLLEEVRACLDDDLDTPGALAAIDRAHGHAELGPRHGGQFRDVVGHTAGVQGGEAGQKALEIGLDRDRKSVV